MTVNSISVREARFLRWVWDAAKTAFRKLRGQKTEKLQRTSSSRRDRLTQQAIEDGYSDELIEDVFARRIDHQTWTLQSRQRIKDMFAAQYMLGRGGRAAMTQADWGRLGAMLKTQYQFLQRFEQDLIDGKLTEAQARARLRMYLQASGQAHERAKTEALGMPRLPAYPKDGQTVCKALCGCEWEIADTEAEWLASWVLGATEHCPDCLDNAARWNPLRVPK